MDRGGRGVDRIVGEEVEGLQLGLNARGGTRRRQG